MTPEVYDVFEMLEFNRILSYYETIEEAIDDFDLAMGLDITKSVNRSYVPEAAKVEAAAPTVVVQRIPQKPAGATGSAPHIFKRPKINERNLPLSEKIKVVVIEDPRKGVFKIRKVLNTERFGYTKINPVRLYQTLKKLNLEDSTKRFRFYRSR
jgi:hypothetical protein